MRLDGRRTSDNVDDRRGKGRGKATLGIGGTIIAGLIIWLMGGNPLSFFTQQAVEGMTSTNTEYKPTAEEEAMALFSKRVFAGTEDVWTAIFQQNGMKYKAPQLVLFTSATTSGCGSASSSTGPFYCPADQSVYIDLSFFNQMKDQLDAGGDFAYAYVIAHEVGHHVQYLLGTLDKVHQQQQRMSQKESNQLNVRLELQADFYAGIWAYYDNKNYNSIEEGDIDEGLNAASQIGDDRLQMKSQGYTVPDAFNHGTSAQRSRWLKKGLQTGKISDGDTFSVPYSQL
ncbi:putative metalloprotease [Dysgonomonas sp. PFB1-18]|uniref:KPN_02809 family neutral zinc metallopeptidase n=1 Tax=unclassified Dysgonomonas TaxID=2630389 RepID=UPI002474B653|nr:MULTISPECIES: neutral zinc metallopeptidase [unclassified Dysgonomonas]MDH6308738.1 putative metalloprotease [Dysgonomonas sp. PF1-14]MDH6338565.1 putative metalloprotease [Dysgonomonas sp. PF1-16]MDH6379987.1 putative metalloprotease [Dysgonomonas sp. PFB1-18]MDH6397393.1 putative metalloprotease [Dysgonomonas sp. PF1-23]